MLKKTIAVIRREFVERVRTKAFIIGTVLGPVFFGAMAIIPGLLLSRGSVGQRVVVVDGTANEFGRQSRKCCRRRNQEAGPTPSRSIHLFAWRREPGCRT